MTGLLRAILGWLRVALHRARYGDRSLQWTDADTTMAWNAWDTWRPREQP